MSTFRIAIGFDFSDQSKLALEQALDAVRSLDAAEIHLIQVVEEHHSGEHPLQRYDRKTELTSAEGKLVEHAHTAVDKPAGVKFLTHARTGRPAEEILQLAHELEADMIFVGTHGRKGLERWVLGSVAETVVRYACCPVLVSRPKNYAERALPDQDD